MTKEQARKKLILNGYTLQSGMKGGYFAKKGQQTYISTSINGLIKKIFG